LNGNLAELSYTPSTREAASPTDQLGGGEWEGAVSAVRGKTQNAQIAMSKTLDVVNETIRDPKHPFRKTEHQPKKALKNRYERRKIKEFLHLQDWLTEEAV
jgi:hypothetical protein